MKSAQSKMLVAREKRTYLFASICSVLAAFFMFYKLFHNELYLKFIDHKWLASVMGLLILGNVIHGFFAFRSFNLLDDHSGIEDIKSIKVTYYKSLIINFLSPYMLLVIFFISIKEFSLSVIAFILLMMMVLGCYYFDLRPTMKAK